MPPEEPASAPEASGAPDTCTDGPARAALLAGRPDVLGIGSAARCVSR